MTTLSERDSLIQIYSDFYKDAYGFRPRGVNYHEFTLEELQADFASFEAICESNDKQEKAHDERMIAEFERRVQSVIDMGAGDRETALRWIADSFDENDFGYGAEFFVAFELGLGQNEASKGIAKEFEPVLYGKAA